MGPKHQQTNPFLLLTSLQERTEYQLLLQQPELTGTKGGSSAKPTHLSYGHHQRHISTALKQ